MSRKFAASLLAGLGLAAVPAGIAPVAQADVCAEGGRYVHVGGCVDPVGDIADAAVIGAEVDRPYGYGYPPPPVEGWPPLPPGYLPFPSFPGEAPCFLPDGQPYYTPGTMPCY